MKQRVSVLGSGGWGIALAIHAYKKGFEVLLWSPFEEEVNSLLNNRTNERLLKGIIIPDEIEITTDLKKAQFSDVAIIATPSFAVRETAAKISKLNCGIIVNVAKGFEKDTMKTLSEVIADEIEDTPIVVLSGPSHAEEVARHVPTTVVAASTDPVAAETVQDMLSDSTFRIYTATDVCGVEIGGALKNVIAVAAGIANGLKVGDNTRAALITRGLAEIARLGTAMGADLKTFMGLSGLGDLIVTCMSEHSRNNRFGNLVGTGFSAEEALRVVGTVEGYYAVAIAVKLGKEHGVELPIIEECYSILYENAPVKEAIHNLMSRPGRTEDDEPSWV
ncbi:MAG: NAD(P)-dependent glycerol-3-phosphate dehydrogenase [Ruminococcaceae bacterium]|nr:NAD(P)-dependent glycerol-3-phosphate dehydrogenase [Oscillospiraceae bacterium]